MTRTAFKGIGANADHAIPIIARTQREAGIEFKAWERRIRPMRPLWYDAIMALGMCAIIGSGLARLL